MHKPLLFFAAGAALALSSCVHSTSTATAPADIARVSNLWRTPSYGTLPPVSGHSPQMRPAKARRMQRRWERQREWADVARARQEARTRPARFASYAAHTEVSGIRLPGTIPAAELAPVRRPVYEPVQPPRYANLPEENQRRLSGRIQQTPQPAAGRGADPAPAAAPAARESLLSAPPNEGAGRMAAATPPAARPEPEALASVQKEPKKTGSPGAPAAMGAKANGEKGEYDHLPFAVPIEGKPGYVRLPGKHDNLPEIDVRGIAPGTPVEIPDPDASGSTIQFRVP